MTRWGSVDYRQMKTFQKKLEQMDKMRDESCTAAAKELAARMVRKGIKRTAGGQYPEESGRVGGTLRSGGKGEV